ncbi:MAG: helix-turn-helix domain-containing protein [Chitinophagales bacterium]
MKLFIKNMISPHSKKQIKGILEGIGLHTSAISTGEVEIDDSYSPQKFDAIREALVETPFDLVLEKEIILIEKIKNIIIEMIHYSKELPLVKYSEYISQKVNFNYTYLSKLFSRIKGITIEHYIIAQKIEKAKQLLALNEMTLSEIAWKLQYSSSGHLSAQFKKVTGHTPSEFKRAEPKNILSPESI